MSTVPLLFRFGRFIVDNSTFNLKYSTINRNTRRIGLCPTYSSYRSIWSNFMKRKEAIASEQKSNIEPEEETQTQLSKDETDKAESSANEQINDLLKALKELKENKDELQDKYKRALAENENIRTRLMKQIEEAKLFGIQGFCKDMLEVSDVLNKATECVPKEEVTDNNPHLKNLYEGLTMTETILKKVFSRHGLVLMNPMNEKFNPNFHEALFEQEVDGKPAGTVVVVSKPGYKLHERVIRPALVGVSK